MQFSAFVICFTAHIFAKIARFNLVNIEGHSEHDKQIRLFQSRRRAGGNYSQDDWHTQVWRVLGEMVAEALDANGAVHTMTEAFNEGKASMNASNDGHSLSFVFREGSIPDIIKNTLVDLAKDEQLTVERINQAFEQGQENTRKYRRHTGYIPDR